MSESVRVNSEVCAAVLSLSVSPELTDNRAEPGTRRWDMGEEWKKTTKCTNSVSEVREEQTLFESTTRTTLLRSTLYFTLATPTGAPSPGVVPASAASLLLPVTSTSFFTRHAPSLVVSRSSRHCLPRCDQPITERQGRGGDSELN